MSGRTMRAARLHGIEDLRIDFEDGLGIRRDGVEDDLALAAARAVVEMSAAGRCPPFVGIRFKSLEAATRARAVRTLELVFPRARS